MLGLLAPIIIFAIPVRSFSQDTIKLPLKLNDFHDLSGLNRVSFRENGNLMVYSVKAKAYDVEPITLNGQITVSDFLVHFKWRSSNKLNTLSNPNIEFGQNKISGSYFSIDCNGVNFLISNKNSFENKNFKQLNPPDLLNKIYSPKQIYFESNLNRYSDEWNETKIIISKQNIEIWQNQFLAFNFSLDDAALLNAMDLKCNNEEFDINFYTKECDEKRFFSNVFKELSTAIKTGSSYLSFRNNFTYLQKDCLVEIKDFEVLNYKPTSLSLNPHKNNEFVKIFSANKNAVSLFIDSTKGFPPHTFQMPLLKDIQPISSIKTPSICTNGLVYYPFRKNLGVPEKAFYFHEKNGFEDIFDFPLISINHLYNNGSIYIFLYKPHEDLWKDRFCESFFNLFLKSIIGKPVKIRSKLGHFEAIAIIEETVPKSIVEHLKKILTVK